MFIFPITSGAMARLAGKTEADDKRTALASEVLRIADARRTLTNAKSVLYGQTFWMVGAAEKLEDAEAKATALRADLDAMGEHHGVAEQEKLLRWHGHLPPMNPAQAARAVEAALRRPRS